VSVADEVGREVARFEWSRRLFRLTSYRRRR